MAGCKALVLMIFPGWGWDNWESLFQERKVPCPEECPVDTPCGRRMRSSCAGSGWVLRSLPFPQGRRTETQENRELSLWV